MKKHLKTLLFAASLVVAISASAQTEQAWSVSDSKLLPDGVAFEIVLTPNIGNPSTFTKAEGRSVTVRINPDEKTIAYSKLKDLEQLPGLPVKIDLSNKTERQALMALLEAYKEHAAGQHLTSVIGDFRVISDASHCVAFKAAAKQYSGAFGQCVGFSDFCSDGSSPDQPLCFSLPNTEVDAGRMALALPEPTALLYIINHQDDFLQLRSAALKKKQEIELAAQQAELAKIKAVDDEHEKQQRLQTIKDAEAKTFHSNNPTALSSSETKNSSQVADVQPSVSPTAEQGAQPKKQSFNVGWFGPTVMVVDGVATVSFSFKCSSGDWHNRSEDSDLMIGYAKKINKVVYEIATKHAEISSVEIVINTKFPSYDYVDDYGKNHHVKPLSYKGNFFINNLSEVRKYDRNTFIELDSYLGKINGLLMEPRTEGAVNRVYNEKFSDIIGEWVFIFSIVAFFIYHAATKDKRGMAPKWYLMGKSIIQNIKAVLKEKDPEKRKALMKTFTKNLGKTSPPPDTSNSP